MSTSNKKGSNKDGHIRLKINEDMIEKPADVATAFNEFVISEPKRLKINEDMIEKPADVATAFNEFVISEPKRISSRLQKCTQTVLPETTKVSNSMSAFPFSESEMLDVINQIKKKKSAGPDQIPFSLIARIGPIVVEPLT
ncbi:hypothetical protein QE152_g4093 [Popillia japonica]|uniref:Reverse transcriptase n=1 Tax=Popillia japonica TaxID=7064 RepID=A0AAW1N1U4_POPJA